MRIISFVVINKGFCLIWSSGRYLYLVNSLEMIIWVGGEWWFYYFEVAFVNGVSKFLIEFVCIYSEVRR